MKRKRDAQLLDERRDIRYRLLSVLVKLELAKGLEFKPRQQTLKIKVASRELRQLHHEILNGLGRQK